MTTPNRRRFQPSIAKVALVGLGVLLIVVCLVLSSFGKSRIGDPTENG